jgi:drug/metabolite transporter (DMT)-like permease
MLVSTVAALAAAALFAFTTNLQRAAASSVPSEGSGPLHLVRRLATDRRWLAGGLIGGAALGLHAIALARGSVMVVQSVMALGLVMALSVEAHRERRRPRPSEVIGSVLVVAGVSAVVVVSHVGHRAGPTGLPVTALCTAIVMAAFVAVHRSRHAVGNRWEARALAALGGACFAVDAVYLQRVAALLDGGLAAGFGLRFPTLAAVVDLAGFFGSAMVGGVAVHRAYQVAPLRSVQPALAAAEPLTAFLLGVTVLHEGVRGGPTGYVALVAGLAAITVGLFVGLGAGRVGNRPVADRPLVEPVQRRSTLPEGAWPERPRPPQRVPTGRLVA